MDMKYETFIQKKKIKVQKVGFDVSELDMNEKLFMFQKHVVKRALKAGRFAIFADCGLGKTFMQLEWAKHVRDYTQKDVLILAPLAVKKQTIEEGSKFGIDVFEGERDPVKPKIIITNYDQLKNLTEEEASLIAFLGEVTSSLGGSFQGTFKGLLNKIMQDDLYSTYYIKVPEGIKLEEKNKTVTTLEKAIERSKRVEINYLKNK